MQEILRRICLQYPVPEYGFNEFIPHSPEIMGVYISKDFTSRQHDPRDHRVKVIDGRWKARW